VNKQDVLKGARGKPVPFEADGFRCFLRPLTWGERRELFEWGRENGEKPGSGLELQERMILAALCDEGGKPLLEAADLKEFDGPLMDALAKEITRRNALDGKAGEPGK
jgi:hypothetical protein